MPELHDARHFFLYAKGHYLKTNLYQDLLKILSDYTGVAPESLSIKSVIEVMSNAVNDHSAVAMVREILEHADRDYLVGTKDEAARDYLRDIILQTLMGRMVNARVTDEQGNQILNLGTADEKVLPFAHPGGKAPREVQTGE